MKRISNIYDQLLSIDNILLADSIARRGKSKQSGVIEFDRNYEQNIADIYRDLVTKTYKVSPYRQRIVKERKERLISILPYRDRIVQHAIMNILEPMFVAVFTRDTYSCIKGRGVHLASYTLRKYLKDVPGTTYCLQLDIKKFYPNVNNAILKSLLRKKIKDGEMLWLLDEIIDSSEGLPIGNYLSQYLSNFYLTYMDHHIKEVLGVLYYLRYADDMIILHSDKSYLHRIHRAIEEYLSANLKLSLKPNRGPFPVSTGVDFGGYKHYHTHVLLRPSIKHAFARAVKANKPMASIASYMGWAKHCNSKNLIKKLIHE
ncbi:MAG TPA: reverse transcriptase domain-containing protein [Sphingobacterium sp.]|nr:reverse transcriptase domain-containing protein [Sphingobacterium sp.]